MRLLVSKVKDTAILLWQAELSETVGIVRGAIDWGAIVLGGQLSGGSCPVGQLSRGQLSGGQLSSRGELS
jgi:hypothetical protein